MFGNLNCILNKKFKNYQYNINLHMLIHIINVLIGIHQNI